MPLVVLHLHLGLWKAYVIGEKKKEEADAKKAKESDKN
jgi:hypothetical protein